MLLALCAGGMRGVWISLGIGINPIKNEMKKKRTKRDRG